jgi:Co/Zn/Cd efflux system component
MRRLTRLTLAAIVMTAIRLALERDTDDRVADLHVWSIGPGLHAAEIAIVTHHPAPPNHYKSLLPKSARLAHTTIEVHHCQGS